MDYNELQPCGNISSKRVMMKMRTPCGAGNSITPSEFVNHGLILWNKGRQKWVGGKKAVNRARKFRMPKLRTLCTCTSKKFWRCLNSTNDSLLRTKKPFPKPIPLGEMVDFLVEIWEEEGLCG